MTIAGYKKLKAALIAQNQKVRHSQKAASALIDDLGIRDIIVSTTPKKVAAKKAVKRSPASK